MGGVPSPHNRLVSRRPWRSSGICALGLLLCSGALPAQSLRPTRASLDRQNQVAEEHHFSYLDDAADVARFVQAGLLVPVASNAAFDVKEGVRFPYARPEVVDFLGRLGERYREACGEKLVATSLVRPRQFQPPNASSRSVHPTGMAFDLRRSWRRECRSYLEGMLVALEIEGVLEANYERHPPHYHVALFPRPWSRFVEQTGFEIQQAKHVVAVGDNLWKIARAYGTTVGLIKQANGLASNTIRPGQLLTVPGIR